MAQELVPSRAPQGQCLHNRTPRPSLIYLVAFHSRPTAHTLPYTTPTPHLASSKVLQRRYPRRTMREKEKPIGLDEYDPGLSTRGQSTTTAHEFWERYNAVTETQDRESFKRLNELLDKLPLFVSTHYLSGVRRISFLIHASGILRGNQGGLFSAISTAFITLAMPSLSPNPTNDTNALLRLLVMKADNTTLTTDDLSSSFVPDNASVIANCMLYASLCCSIIAASGALLGQEWLQELEQTESTTPDLQGRSRVLKWANIERWHLVTIIRLLPNLLTISVLLFFPGLFVFLLGINTKVAYVVLALTTIPILTIVLTTTAAALDPSCPFQNASSYNLRALWIKLRIPLAPFYSVLLGTFPKSGHKTSSTVTEPRAQDESNSRLDASAVITLLDFPLKLEDYLLVGQYILSLDPRAFAFAIRDHRALSKLLVLTSQAMEVWKSKGSGEKQRNAESFVLAVYHYIVGSSNDQFASNGVARALPQELFRIRRDYDYSDLAEVIIHGTLSPWIWSVDHTETGYLLRKAVLHKVIASRMSFDPVLADLVISAPYDDVILNLLATWVVQSFEQTDNGLTSARELYLGRSVGIEHNLANAFSPPVLEATFRACQQGSNPLRVATGIYTTFLGMLKHLADQGRLVDEQLLTNLDLSLKAMIRRWTTSEDEDVFRSTVAVISTFIAIRKIKGREMSDHERDVRQAIIDALGYVVSRLCHFDGSTTARLLSALDTSIIGAVQHMPEFWDRLNLEELEINGIRAAYFISTMVGPFGHQRDPWIKHLDYHLNWNNPFWGWSEVEKDFGECILSKLKDPKLGASRLNLVRMIPYTGLGEGSSWALYLVKNGLIDITVDLISSPSQQTVDMQYQTLILLLQVWKRTAAEPDVDWATNKVISAVSRATADTSAFYRGTTRAEGQANPDFKVKGTDIGPDTLVEFFEDIRKRRGDSVLLSLGLDTALRNFSDLYGVSRGTEWNYHLYGNPAPLLMTCSRLRYSRDDGVL
ncbi:hypothetical protein FRC01_010643 [Tulasnella sp. 417]|nr:hypothetical protein FRC01_010643 [Tulasnella sp. 417]